MSNNFERMLELVNSSFDTRNDPEQISVSAKERDKLERIHPATLSELANEDGPIVWLLVLPTTELLRNDFLAGRITERQLLEQTRPGDQYGTLYLCSASVLPEYQRQGLAKKVALEAINRIREDHPIRSLFYWPFSSEGKLLAESLARATALTLLEKIA